jgi:hypothetical protein
MSNHHSLEVGLRDDDNWPSRRYLGKWNAGTGLMTLAQLFHVPSGFLARLRLLPAAGRFLLWLFSVLMFTLCLC